MTGFLIQDIQMGKNIEANPAAPKRSGVSVSLKSKQLS